MCSVHPRNAVFVFHPCILHLSTLTTILQFLDIVSSLNLYHGECNSGKTEYICYFTSVYYVYIVLEVKKKRKDNVASLLIFLYFVYFLLFNYFNLFIYFICLSTNDK